MLLYSASTLQREWTEFIRGTMHWNSIQVSSHSLLSVQAFGIAHKRLLLPRNETRKRIEFIKWMQTFDLVWSTIVVLNIIQFRRSFISDETRPNSVNYTTECATAYKSRFVQPIKFCKPMEKRWNFNIHPSNLKIEHRIFQICWPKMYGVCEKVNSLQECMCSNFAVCETRNYSSHRRHRPKHTHTRTIMSSTS